MEVLEKSDEKAKVEINNAVIRFIDVTNESMSVKGLKWDDLVLRFEWTFEADRIRGHLNEKKTLEDWKKNEIT